MKKIFVSSTFRDMHTERDLIQTIICPDLNEKAYQNRMETVKFQDLRWGIDTDLDLEEDGDKKILEVCLDEIKNNRPYFLLLLGDVYGWIPDGDLIKETGIRYGIYDPSEKLEKSIINLEIDFGFLRNPQYAKKSYAYFRNITGDIKGTVYESSPEEKAKIALLKKEIRKVLPKENIHEYDVIYEDGKLIGVEKFIDLVKKDMEALLFDWQNLEENISENQRKILYHQSQAKEKSTISNVRLGLENKILEDIKNTNILTIKGKSGNGKSTLMSKISRRIAKKYKSIILYCSLTPKTTSTDGLMKIISEYIKQLLVEEGEIDFEQSKEKFFDDRQENLLKEKSIYKDKNQEEYQNSIKTYQNYGKEEIIILIDAVDQLEYPEDIVDLLAPVDLNKKQNIKFIISYLEEDDAPYQYAYLNEFKNYKLLDLDDEDKLAVIDSILLENNKELPQEIKKEIAKKKSSASPLYISLLVQRLLMMNNEDYQKIISAGDGYHIITNYQKDLIKNMPEDLEEVILELITQASKNLRTNTDDIKKTISYLAVSRRGLRQSDLKIIYELKGVSYNILDFARLKKYLSTFFLEDSFLRIDFTHKIIRKAINNFISKEEKVNIYKDISNAFIKLPANDPVKLEEQYYSAYMGDNLNAALELIISTGKQYKNILPEDIAIAVESISKIHNLRIKDGDYQWLKRLFEEFSKTELNIQKPILAYIIYMGYEEKTSDSMKASKFYGTELLFYIKGLLETYPDDEVLLRFYADQLIFLAMKYNLPTIREVEKSNKYLLEAIEINKNLYEKDKTYTNKERLANTYSNIAKFNVDLGNENINKAESYYKKSIGLFEKLAEDNEMASLENLAMAYNNIANLYSSTDNKEAKSYYKKSIVIMNRLLRRHNDINQKKTLSMTFINVAKLYYREEKFEKAERWYLRSIKIIKEIAHLEPSLESKEALAKAYSDLADLFSSELIEEKDKALDLYHRSMRLYESILRHKDLVSAKRSLAASYENLANIYADLEDPKAYSYYQKSINLKEKIIDLYGDNEDILSLAKTYNNLAFINWQEEKLSIAYYKKAIDILLNIKEKKLEKIKEENIAACFSNMADLYYKLKDLEKSNKYYKKAIEIEKNLIEVYKDDYNIEMLIIIYNNIATRLIDGNLDPKLIEERYFWALELLETMKEAYNKTKKKAIIFNNLGNFYYIEYKDYEKSEDYYLKSIDLTKWLIGEHRSIENIERLMVSYLNIAKLYSDLGKEELSKKYLMLAKNIYIKNNYQNKRKNTSKFIHIHKNKED